MYPANDKSHTDLPPRRFSRRPSGSRWHADSSPQTPPRRPNRDFLLQHNMEVASFSTADAPCLPVQVSRWSCKSRSSALAKAAPSQSSHPQLLRCAFAIVRTCCLGPFSLNQTSRVVCTYVKETASRTENVSLEYNAKSCIPLPITSIIRYRNRGVFVDGIVRANIFNFLSTGFHVLDDKSAT